MPNAPEGVKHQVITSAHIELAAQNLGRQINRFFGPNAMIYGIPRGGVCSAYAILAYTPGTFVIVPDARQAQVLIDDLVDSGKTRDEYLDKHPSKIFAVLFDKSPLKRNHFVGLQLSPDIGWLDFPWEARDAV